MCDYLDTFYKKKKKKKKDTAGFLCRRRHKETVHREFEVIEC